MKRTSILIPLLAFSLPLAVAPSLAAEKTNAATTQTAPAAAADKPADGAEAKPEQEKIEDGNVDLGDQNNKTVDASRRLREKLATVETELATLTKPSRGLTSRCKSAKKSLDTQLDQLDKAAMEVASLQEKFNNVNNRDYEFSIVHGDQRDQYVIDGQAAHKAMVIDVKEKRSSRKIAGLDKFEIMRERYQGMPEYKEANEWYNRTIDDLEKRWSKMHDAEKARRAKLNSAKAQRMEEDDEREFRKLENYFKSTGEDIAKVWYVPSARNLRMLSNCLNKVRDVKRRREVSVADKDSIGCVPSLLTQFWSMMDNARSLMLNGDLEGAQKAIDSDPSFNRIVRLNRNVMPDEYKDPIKNQRQDIIKEIRSRGTENTQTQRALERKIADLERKSSTIEARIDSLLEEIDRERGVDAGENTASVKDADMEEEKKDDAQGAETPAPEEGKDDKK